MSDYFESSCKPIKCFTCDSENITEIVTDTLDMRVHEFKCICDECGEEVGYWAHGYYDPAYSMAHSFLHSFNTIFNDIF